MLPNNPQKALKDAERAAAAEKRQYSDAAKNLRTARQEYDRIVNEPLAQYKPADVATPSAGGGGKKVGGKKDAGSSSPSLADVERQFYDQLSGLAQQTLAARASIATSAEEQAELDGRSVELARIRTEEGIKADTQFGAVQKQRLLDQVEALAEAERAAIDFELRRRLEQEALDTAQSSLRNDQDIARAQGNLAETRQERRDIESRILDLAFEQERLDLEAILASEAASQAQKDIAAARLRILGQLKGYETEGINRQFESPLDQRRREVRETAKNMTDTMESIELDAIDRLTGGIADASTEFIKLGGVAGDVLNGIIRDMVRLAAQQAIFGSAGGGGGILGSIGGMLGIGGGLSGVNYGAISNAASTVRLPGFGGARATGGPVAGGKTYLVGEEGPELFTAPTSGRIIPNHNLAAAASMVGATAAGVNARPVQQTVVVRVEANDYFDARVDQRAAGVAVPAGMAASESARQAAGLDAMRAARRRIPGR